MNFSTTFALYFSFISISPQFFFVVFILVVVNNNLNNHISQDKIKYFQK